MIFIDFAYYLAEFALIFLLFFLIFLIDFTAVFSAFRLLKAGGVCRNNAVLGLNAPLAVLGS